MSGSVTLTAGAELCHLPASFPLERGGSLGAPVLAFERQGPAGAPVVAVLGGISAGRHTSAHPAVRGPGWWEGCVGPGLAVDTSRFQVLSFDWLGGAGASTGPRPGAAFPSVTPADQALALAALLDWLSVPRLHAVIGASYGGMVGLHFAARFPQRLLGLGCIAAAHEPHPMATAFRSVQRRILAFGLEVGREREAAALARSLAMATYRGRREFAARFAAAALPGSARFPVEDYLEQRGEDFAARFPAAAYLRLCESIDLHRVEPGAVRVETWLIGFDSDQIVPPEQIAALAAQLPQLRRSRILATPYGHDGFLKEVRALRPLIREVLR